MVSNLYRTKLGFVSPGNFYACSQNFEDRLLASSCVPVHMEQRGCPGTDIHWIIDKHQHMHFFTFNTVLV